MGVSVAGRGELVVSDVWESVRGGAWGACGVRCVGEFVAGRGEREVSGMRGSVRGG